MSALVSKTLIRDARKHLKANMVESATIVRTGKTVPCLVVVQRWAVHLHGTVSGQLRARKWNILMPASAPSVNPDAAWGGTSVNEGDRAVVTGHGTFMVVEVTDPNTYNVATSVWGVLTNASVKFSRAGGTGDSGSVDVYIQRVSDEMKSYGIEYEWEVWWDASIVLPAGTTGGQLISKGDKMLWNRSPNPFPFGGVATLDKPRYAYGENGNPVVSAYFKETL